MLFNVDAASRGRVEGWIAAPDNPAGLAIDIVLDGVPTARVAADRPRPDVGAVGSPGAVVYGFAITEAEAPGLTRAGEVEMRAGDLTLYRSRRVAQVARERLFFMHIPKTGGTSLNHVLNPLFENAYNHIESRDFTTLQSLLSLREPRSLFLSGHLLFHNVSALLLGVPTRLATLLRRPLDHLISHLAWVYRVAHDPDHHLAHDSAIMTAGRRVGAIDLDDEGSVAAWVESLDSFEKALFYNLQTRYLGCDDPARPAAPEHLGRALETVRRFDVVGRVERIDLFALRLDKMLGMDLGPIPLMRVNPDDEKFKVLARFDRSLRPLLELDEVVYDEVLRGESVGRRLAAGWRRAVSP